MRTPPEGRGKDDVGLTGSEPENPYFARVEAALVARKAGSEWPSPARSPWSNSKV